MEFVPLRVHSWFSFLTAPSPPGELCRRAAGLGLSALALTDVGGLWGAPEFEEAADAAGVRPILGAELPTGEGRLVLLARDGEGYRSLCRLVSAFHLDESFDPVRTTARESAGLFVLADSPRFLARLALRIPPDTLFAGLPAPVRAGPGRPGRSLPPDQVIPKGRKLPDPPRPPAQGEVREAARGLGLRLVALPDVYRAGPSQAERHRLLLAVKKGIPLDLQGDPGGTDLPGPEEIRAWYEGYEDAVERTLEIAGACRARLLRGEPPLFPPYRSREGETAGERLRELALEGLERFYGPGAVEARRRLEEELEVIRRSGFAPYFLVLQEIADFARREGIPCMGRGSAADSLVARCLGLTEPDPIRHGLVFERFLNAGRGDLPDVDLDFCWKRRRKVLDYVFRRFGRDRTAMLCTLVRLGPRGAYREAALACGIPPRLASAASARLPRSRRRNLDEALAEAGDLAPLLGSSRLAEKTARAAELLLGAPHHVGLHPGGTVIAPVHLRDFLPLQPSAEGFTAVQFDKHYIEETGAVKLDLLGNRGLTLVDYALENLRERRGRAPDPEEIPRDDPAAGRLVREGRTLGCFQIESPAMRQILRAMRASREDQVIQALALVRPGPASGGMKRIFLARARGEEPVERIDPGVDRELEETLGVMLYQEDVLKVARAAAGLSLEEADRLRKELARARKDPEGARRLGEAFVLAARERGLSAEGARRTWEQLSRFCGYSFCKAHAVSYGRLAWKCAWLKAREPAAFMAALLSSGAGMYATTVYVEEARRMGLKILPPHVNLSGARWKWEGERGLRVSLAEVRGVGEEMVEEILEARRRGGPFRSLEDLAERVPGLARDALENLVLAGALDGLGPGRGEMILALRLRRKRGAPKGWFGRPLPALSGRGRVPGPTELEKARLAMEVLGFHVGAHPLTLEGRARPSSLVGCGMASRKGGRVLVQGWVIALRKVRLEGGKGVVFLTLEDETGLVEVVCREGCRILGRVEPWAVLRVEGRVETRMGAPLVEARLVRKVGEPVGIPG